jgi:hypothetical protein
VAEVLLAILELFHQIHLTHRRAVVVVVGALQERAPVVAVAVAPVAKQYI